MLREKKTTNQRYNEVVNSVKGEWKGLRIFIDLQLQEIVNRKEIYNFRKRKTTEHNKKQ